MIQFFTQAKSIDNWQAFLDLLAAIAAWFVS